MVAGRYELVIFDFDGTLADTGPVICGAFSHAVQGTAAERPPAGFQIMLGQPLEHVHAWLVETVPGYLLSESEFIARYRVGYYALADDLTTLFAGVDALTLELPTPMAIASSKPSDVLLENVASLGITDRFAHIQGTDGFPYKPNPTIVHRVWERVPATPRGTVFVGDAVTDIQAGRAAGVATIGVTWGAHSADALRGAGAEWVVDTVEALRALLF